MSKEYPPEGMGGIANYVSCLANGLAAAGHDVTVIAGPAHPNNSGRMPRGSQRNKKRNQLASGIRLDRVDNYRLALPAPIRRKARGIWNTLERSLAVDREIARLERSQGPFDVVEMPNWGAEGLCYSLHPRAPLVIRLSTPLAQVSRLMGERSNSLGLRLACFLEAIPAKRCARLIANSQFIAKYCSDLYRIADARPVLISQGIPVPTNPPLKNKTDSKVVTILYVGRLERRKGIDCLLQAIPKVASRLSHCKFVIAGEDIGDAPQGSSYREYFSSFASPVAREKTTFMGFVKADALSHLYADCDVFIAPSLSESFGLIYLEAMAHAKPVVAFHAGAVPEVVAHSETGILVERGNISEVANALVRLAGDAKMRQDMGMRGYERMLTKFTAQCMVEETVACYRQVIAESGKGQVSPT